MTARTRRTRARPGTHRQRDQLAHPLLGERCATQRRTQKNSPQPVGKPRRPRFGLKRVCGGQHLPGLIGTGEVHRSEPPRRPWLAHRDQVGWDRQRPPPDVSSTYGPTPVVTHPCEQLKLVAAQLGDDRRGVTPRHCRPTRSSRWPAVRYLGQGGVHRASRTLLERSARGVRSDVRPHWRRSRATPVASRWRRGYRSRSRQHRRPQRHR